MGINRRDALVLTGASAAVLATPALASDAKLSFPTVDETKIFNEMMDWIAEQALDGKSEAIVLSREQYRIMYRHGHIDWLCDDEAETPPNKAWPYIHGHRVRVPGSALA